MIGSGTAPEVQYHEPRAEPICDAAVIEKAPSRLHDLIVGAAAQKLAYRLVRVEHGYGHADLLRDRFDRGDILVEEPVPRGIDHEFEPVRLKLRIKLPEEPGIAPVEPCDKRPGGAKYALYHKHYLPFPKL